MGVVLVPTDLGQVLMSNLVESMSIFVRAVVVVIVDEVFLAIRFVHDPFQSFCYICLRGLHERLALGGEVFVLRDRFPVGDAENFIFALGVFVSEFFDRPRVPLGVEDGLLALHFE